MRIALAVGSKRVDRGSATNDRGLSVYGADTRMIEIPRAAFRVVHRFCLAGIPDDLPMYLV